MSMTLRKKGSRGFSLSLLSAVKGDFQSEEEEIFLPDLQKANLWYFPPSQVHSSGFSWRFVISYEPLECRGNYTFVGSLFFAEDVAQNRLHADAGLQSIWI